MCEKVNKKLKIMIIIKIFFFFFFFFRFGHYLLVFCFVFVLRQQKKKMFFGLNLLLFGVALNIIDKWRTFVKRKMERWKWKIQIQSMNELNEWMKWISVLSMMAILLFVHLNWKIWLLHFRFVSFVFFCCCCHHHQDDSVAFWWLNIHIYILTLSRMAARTCCT